MSIERSANFSLRSGEVPLNIFHYLWQALQHYSLIGIVGVYLVRNTYQRTLLGPTWLLVHSLLPLIGMMVIFQHVVSFPTGDLPYPLFLIAGMALWTIIDVGIKRGIRNLILVKRIRKVIHVPRIAMTIAGLALPLFYHLVFVVFLLGVSAFMWFVDGRFFIVISWNLMYAFISVVLTMLLVIGISAISSVLFLIARDIRYIMAPLVQFWFFFTPVVYPLEILPEPLRAVCQYGNPMSSIMHMYRYGLFGIGGAEPQAFVVAAAVTVCIFLFGVWFMMRSDWILDEIL